MILLKQNEVHKQSQYCLTCDKTSHSVIIEKKSRISKILNTGDNIKIDVNSNHNYIVGNLGKGVVITGKSPDEVPEILEVPSYNKFLLAVQWNPEFISTNADKKIIKSFCNAVENNI